MEAFTKYASSFTMEALRTYPTQLPTWAARRLLRHSKWRPSTTRSASQMTDPFPVSCGWRFINIGSLLPSQLKGPSPAHPAMEAAAWELEELQDLGAIKNPKITRMTSWKTPAFEDVFPLKMDNFQCHVSFQGCNMFLFNVQSLFSTQLTNKSTDSQTDIWPYVLIIQLLNQ